MKPVVVSAILYGLVGAACLTGCADHPGNHQAVRAEQSGSAMPSTLLAPAVKHHEVNAAGSQKAETSRRNPPGAIQGETDTNPSVENEYDVDTSE